MRPGQLKSVEKSKCSLYIRVREAILRVREAILRVREAILEALRLFLRP